MNNVYIIIVVYRNIAPSTFHSKTWQYFFCLFVCRVLRFLRIYMYIYIYIYICRRCCCCSDWYSHFYTVWFFTFHWMSSDYDCKQENWSICKKKKRNMHAHSELIPMYQKKEEDLKHTFCQLKFELGTIV